ncbi:MAG: DUF2341 domain-containing protein [Fibrobacter sp.]|nr:DUF2341 domain-containing protein [Fibrobacter sp.]
MKKIITISLSIFLLCTLFILACTKIGDIAGAGSETTNCFTGIVVSADGSPAANAIVQLYPSSFDPVKNPELSDSFVTTTNDRGVYEFKDIDTGRYNIFVKNHTDETRALISNIHAIIDTVEVPEAKLDEPGAVKVMTSENMNSTTGYVYIPGTPIFSFINTGCKPAVLNAVPAGVIPEIVISTTNSQSTSVLRHNITVKSADTIVAANPEWSYYKRIFLNTSETGVILTNNIYDFPVLIRLNNSNFDFKDAKPDGADILFTTTNNKVLFHEIERWDSSAAQAEIWVRVDTIYANNARQNIVMYWGNPLASLSSNPNMTFDTALGFQGVWHLSEDGASTAFDATANSYHGTPYGMSSASAVKGAIGIARSFNGTSSYISMLNTSESKLDFPENGYYSMSLWVYADTIDSIYHAIAGKGHEQYYMQFKCFKSGKATWEFVEFHDQKGWEYTQDSTPPAPGAKQWLYLTGIRSGKQQWLYINGEKVVDTAAVMAGTSYARNTLDNFMIGSYGRSVTIPYSQGKSFFHGRIDEVRVCSVVPSDDWIRLCYENQKQNDALVKFDD